MAIRTRVGRETDAPFLAWVILTAARSHREKGWFDIVLRRPARLPRVSQATDAHLDTFLVALLEVPSGRGRRAGRRRAVRVSRRGRAFALTAGNGRRGFHFVGSR